MPEGLSVGTSVRVGRAITDAEFDSIYPEWVRRASEMHWTPYAVARRAAALLVLDSTTRVLDVGSGAGKFCLIGSLATDGLFFGVEQRAGLVEVAEQAAHRCGATRVHFIHGNITSIDWGNFDAFYFYNPFYEHVAEMTPSFEERIDCSPALFARYVTLVSEKLFSARVGTRVVTYQGYGAAMPAGYRRLARESFDGCDLELWRKEPLAAVLESPSTNRSNEYLPAEQRASASGIRRRSRDARARMWNLVLGPMLVFALGALIGQCRAGGEQGPQEQTRIAATRNRRSLTSHLR
jgi:SAM-dependent methyltransferase